MLCMAAAVEAAVAQQAAGLEQQQLQQQAAGLGLRRVQA